MQSLENVLINNDFIYETREEPGTEIVTEIFFLHQDSRVMWRAFPHVMMIDATYKTNIYNMPFIQIVGMTPTNKSFIIAHAVVSKERGDNFVWVLERVKSMLDECMEPRVILTDRDLALMGACAKVFPDASRLLCRWHIQQNVMKHCKGAFTDDDWKKFMSFWGTLIESPSIPIYDYHLRNMRKRLVECKRSIFIMEDDLMPGDDIHLEPVQQGPRRRQRPPVDTLQGHPYLEFPDGTDAARHCQKLRRMHVGSHPSIDWDAMDEIAETPRVRRFIPIDSPWHRLFDLAHTPTYRELLVEFLSSFTFHPPGEPVPLPYPGAPHPPEVSFRLAGVMRSMTLAEFAVHCGLYMQEEIETEIYTAGLVVVEKPTLVGFWQVIAGADHWEHEKSKGRVSFVRDPLYRYLHHLLATSISARGYSRGWCTTTDLFFLYCLLYRRPCALAHGLAQYFASGYHRQERGFLYGGAYVTVIARSLGLVPHQDPHLRTPAIMPTRMGMQSLWGMRVIKRFPVGPRFKNRDGGVWREEALPEHFEPVHPPADPADVVPVEDPPEDLDGAAPPQPPLPAGAPQFPRHVIRGHAPGAALHPDVRAELDRLNDLVTSWCFTFCNARVNVNSLDRTNNKTN
ncbi:uncharacterized protein LOC118484905 [Helianthus annuus]|uniref:uncharacterized protein LOC118484905 n=1 Tax=Helianthus annuus TaxID=4232 RepID=UPI0016530E0C|nr:uncharacterized protein LOC118484905 [Helianthus annuus]